MDKHYTKKTCNIKSYLFSQLKTQHGKKSINEFFHSVCNDIDNPVCVIDLNGNIIHFNNDFEPFLKTTSEKAKIDTVFSLNELENISNGSTLNSDDIILTANHRETNNQYFAEICKMKPVFPEYNIAVFHKLEQLTKRKFNSVLKAHDLCDTLILAVKSDGSKLYSNLDKTLNHTGVNLKEQILYEVKLRKLPEKSRNLDSIDETIGVSKNNKHFSFNIKSNTFLVESDLIFLYRLYDITSIIQEQKSLVKSENKYRELVESNYDVIFSHTIDGKITYVSPSIEKYGWKQSELIGSDFSNFIHPDDLFDVMNDLKMTMRTGITFPSTFRFMQKDGDYIHAEEMSHIIKKNDEIVAFNGVMRDITERKLTEDSLREAEERYRSIFEHIIDVYFRSDRDGNLSLISPSGVRMLGYETSLEMLGKNIVSTFYVDPSDGEKLQRMHNNTDKVIGFATRLKRKDGQIIDAEINSVAIYDHEGNFAGFEGIIRDFTSRVEIENRLRDSESRYRTLVETSLEAIFIYQDGMLLYNNSRAKELTGYSIEEINDQGLAMLIHPEDIRKIKPEAWEGSIEGSYLIEVRILDKNKEIKPVEIFLCDITYQSKNAKMAIVRDLSEKRKSELALKASENRFYDLTNLLPQNVFEFNEKGQFLFVNKAGLDMFGYKVEDIKNGLSVFETISKDSIPKLKKRFGQIFSLKTPLEPTEYIAIDRNGIEFPVRIYSSPIIIDDEIKGLRGILINISEEKRIQKELTFGRERLHLALTSAKEGMWDWDIESGSVFYNSGWNELTGYDHDNKKSDINTWLNIVHPDDFDMVNETLKKHLAGDSPDYEIEHRIKRKNGQWRWVIAHGKVIEYDSNQMPKRALGTFVDITKFKTLERKLADSEKMESIERLSSWIIQSLGNVLDDIKHCPNECLNHDLENNEIYDYVQNVLQATNEAEKTLQELIEITSLNKSSKKEFELTHLVEETVYHFVESYNLEQIKIENEDSEKLSTVFCSDTQIRKSILNLLKFITHVKNNDSNLSIEFKCINPVNLSSGKRLKNHKCINTQFTISNFVLDDEDIKHLFEPFYALKRFKLTDTHISMPLIWYAINENNGKIHITHDNRNTFFSLILPLIKY